MISMLEEHELSEVAGAAAAVMSAGGARPQLDRLIPELERELAQTKGHIVVHATSAHNLPDGILERFSQELAHKLSGTSYELQSSIDPKLLGGAHLTTADVSLDLTLDNQLQTLRISHG